MNGSLVQWTLLNNLDYLSKILDFPIALKIGQEITTEFGRIDFVLEDSKMNQLIVELETVLNNKSKLDYCFNQMLNYKNFRYSVRGLNIVFFLLQRQILKAKELSICLQGK